MQLNYNFNVMNKNMDLWLVISDVLMSGLINVYIIHLKLF